ncbi:hypothetical protein D1007_59809 [Hordeum vulgare]|nr:hypothetical protein D1007_59809 [Hordeum vulgare]
MRMWDSINPSTDELISIDMILMDEQGHTIHATIWKNLIDNYKSKIDEGSIYAFSNFKVVDSTKYRPVSNEIKITFLYNTKLKEMKGSSDNFPNYYFEFASKDTLQERLEKDKQCSDVIGLLTKIKPIESRITKKKTPSDIREIEILMPEGDKIRVSLWGRLAHHLSEDVIGNQTIIIVTSTMVQKFNGLCLKSTSATRLYTNLDIPETWELRGRYRIRLQISDHSATTSCTLFDEEAERMLNTLVSFLLDSLDGKCEEVPKIIQELCGQRLIFRFKLNNKNLTLGMQNYAVKKIFVPDEKLDKRYLEDKTEEDLMDDEVDNILKKETKKLNEPVKKVKITKCELSKNICELVPVKEEPEDKSNGSTIHQKEYQQKKSSTSFEGVKRRRRSVVLSDSEDEENENNISVISFYNNVSINFEK